MTKQKIVFVLMATLAIFVSACGSNPASPTPPSTPSTPSTPAAVSFRVTDGLTGSPVVGATVSVSATGGYTGQTDSSGTIQLPNGYVGENIVISAAGYRDYTTLYCGFDKSLWENKPGDVDDAMTSTIGYDTLTGGGMLRPDSVNLVLSPEFWNDTDTSGSTNSNPMTAKQALQAAADKAMAAVQGKTKITLTQADGSGANFHVMLDPNTASGTVRIFAVDGVVQGDTIKFASVRDARFLPRALFVVTRTLGVTGNSPYPGVMGPTLSFLDFTPAEQHLLLLRYTRRPRSQFAGDNDRMLGCAGS